MVMSNINPSEYVSTSTAAKKVGGVSTDTITRYCLNYQEGKSPAIKATRFFGKWLIHKDDLAAFKETRQPVGRPKAQ